MSRREKPINLWKQYEDIVNSAIRDAQGTVRNAIHDAQGTVQNVIHDAQGTVQNVIQDAQGTIEDAQNTIRDPLKKENKIIRQIVFSLFLVSFLTMLTSLIGSTLDGLIVSHFLGEEVFGSFNLAGPLLNFIEMLAGVIATGTVVACSNRIGSGDKTEANKFLRSGFTTGLLLGGIAAVLLFIFPQAARVLVSGDKGESFLPLMYEYVRGMAPGIPAIMLSTLFVSIVQLDGGKKRVLISAVVLCVVNIAGDLAVVLLTDFGLLGVGLVTSISYYCSLAVLASHFLRKESVFKLGFSFFGLHKSIPYGIPSLVNRLATLLRNLTYNTFSLTAGGPAGMVAWSTVNSLTAFLSGFPKSFGQEALVGSGVFYGEKDKDSLRRFMKLSFLVGGGVTAVVAVLVIAASPLLIGLYLSSDSESYGEAVSGIRWYAAGLIPYTINLIFANYLQNAKKKVITNIISFMDGFGMLAVYALFFLKFIGFHGLWYTFFCGKLTVLIVTMIYVFIRNKKAHVFMSEFLMLPDDFDVPRDDRFIVTILNKEEAMNVSEKVIRFCSNRNVSKDRSFHVGLAIEEMCCVIVDEGFIDNKEHSIDIKIFIKDNDITIRMRDDCEKFDHQKRLNMMNPEDPASHPGIRLIKHFSTDTEFYSTLNVNYLVLHINSD